MTCLSRTTAATLFAAALLAAACGEPSGGTSSEGAPSGGDWSPSVTSTGAPVPVTPGVENPDGTPATLIAVLDGDSLAVDLGAGRAEVRLVGINAPEIDECYGDASRTALGRLLADTAIVVRPAGDDDRDHFGRLLRDVFAGGVWVNRAQVASGNALALQSGSAGEPDLVAAEDAAYETGLGMWSASACGAADALPSIRIGDIRYDPPGRDFENSREELVSIVNRGPTAVELAGWVIRDESSRHRYRFPDHVLEAGTTVLLRTGCGDDDEVDLFWCADDAVWSNGGDTVILQLPNGAVVDRLKYPGDF